MPLDVPVFGMQAVLGLLRSGGPVERLVIARGRAGRRLDELLDAARERRIPVRRVERRQLDRLAGDGAAHQGVLAITSRLRYRERSDVLDAVAPPALLAVLDGVQDPRNLGAILRTAAATGVQGVFLPARRAVGVTPTVAKAAAGTAGRVPLVRETSLDDLLRDLARRGIWRVAVEASGDPVWSGFDFRQPVALVVGGEGAGLRPLLRKRCDLAVGLPLAGGVEALNVSVAFGAVVFEILRQRRESLQND